MTATIHSWGDAVQSAFATGFGILLAGIPKIIGFLTILIVGRLIASAIAKAVQMVLHAVKFNEVADRAGVTGFVRNVGLTTDASAFMAQLAKWFVRLIALVAAFDALGLPSVSAVLNRLLFWLPNLAMALVVLVLAGLIAGALSRIVRGAATEAGLGNPNLLAMLASWAIWALGFLVALYQIGVAPMLVSTLFMGVVAALALAFGLAFGLGGRDTASQIVSTGTCAASGSCRRSTGPRGGPSQRTQPRRQDQALSPLLKRMDRWNGSSDPAYAHKPCLRSLSDR